MLTLRFILLLLALFCFVAAAAGVPSRVNWAGAGLALLTIAWLIMSYPVQP